MQLDELLTRGVAEITVARSVQARLESGKKLRLKQGFDPTRPHMHVGHCVGLRKLRAFQELGHQVVLIIGDWTAQIGDPSGRDTGRSRLDAETVAENAKTYMQQFFTIVDSSRTEVRWQSEWYGSFRLEQALGLLGRFTLAQILAHETFRKRHDAGAPLSLLELMYPILQGYDSVIVQADIEFGGTDQKFNNLAGRELMGQLGLPPQDILLVPLIPGIDGRKMSKSFANTIDIEHSAFEMFSRTMALQDDALPIFFETLTNMPMAELSQLPDALANGDLHPMHLKRQLGRMLVSQFHSPKETQASEQAWLRQFSQRQAPEEMPILRLAAPTSILDVLIAAQLAESKSAARRLIDAGAVRINGEKLLDYQRLLRPENSVVLQLGRRTFVRVSGES